MIEFERPPGSRAPSQLVFEMIADAVFLAWWVGLFRFSDFWPSPPPITFELAPFWKTVFWPVLAWAASELAIDALELAQPGMVRVLSGLKLIRYIGGAMLAVTVLQADLLVQVASSTLPAGFTGTLEAWVNLGGRIGYVVLAVSLVLKAAGSAWRLIRGAPSPMVSPA